METTNRRTPVNIVSSFFFYMWNYWSEEECRQVFGWNYQHFWGKWCAFCKPSSFGAAERFYSELDMSNQEAIVNRACECYDRDHKIIK